MSGYSATDRGPNTYVCGAYLSGTCSSGDWVVWCPGNSKTDLANWKVQKSPTSPTDWDAGAYMLAGVCYNHGNDPAPGYGGDIVTIICGGFTPKGRVVDPGGAILNDGYPLALGGTPGGAQPYVSGDAVDAIGCALEIPGVATPTTVKCLVRNL